MTTLHTLNNTARNRQVQRTMANKIDRKFRFSRALCFFFIIFGVVGIFAALLPLLLGQMRIHGEILIGAILALINGIYYANSFTLKLTNGQIWSRFALLRSHVLIKAAAVSRIEKEKKGKRLVLHLEDGQKKKIDLRFLNASERDEAVHLLVAITGQTA